MKKQVHFILIAFLAVFSSNLYAQFGVQAGYTYLPSNGNLTLGSFNEFSGTTRNHGFRAGLTYDFHLKGDLGMQTGLFYAYAGGKTSEPNRTFLPYVVRGIQLTTSAYQFLELPVHVSYSLPVTNEFKFFFFGGPSFAYALQGKSTSQFKEWNIPDEYSIYEDFQDFLSPFELKVGGGLGVHYKNYRAKIGYDQGILNIYNGEKRKNDNGAINKLKRNQISFSVGYVF